VTPKKIIHGDDLLYRFFQDALRSNPELFATVPQLLITAMGLWLPLDAYKRWPVLLPWVVRDPKCRGNPRRGFPDEWSSPNQDGFLRALGVISGGFRRLSRPRPPRPTRKSASRGHCLPAGPISFGSGNPGSSRFIIGSNFGADRWIGVK
jgi:hypothetical protein